MEYQNQVDRSQCEKTEFVVSDIKITLHGWDTRNVGRSGKRYFGCEEDTENCDAPLASLTEVERILGVAWRELDPDDTILAGRLQS